VKTDRRDAEKLARCYRAGDLTAVWVPDAAQEALRDLVRAREAAKKDQLKARHRLGKFLLRHGRRPEGMKAWTVKHLEWIKIHVKFDQPALEATLEDYLQEVEHVAERIAKLEKAIDEAVQAGATRDEGRDRSVAGIARSGTDHRGHDRLRTGESVAVRECRQLMGYSGWYASEHSSGNG
jgi:transposase